MTSLKRKNSATSKDETDSDDEIPSNTIGSSVPLKWYENHDHIGYDLDAKKILKPESTGKSDEIDEFLEKMENPDYWRTVYDDLTGQNVTLTNDDIVLIQQMKNAQTYGDDNVYEPWVDTFTSEVMIHPILNAPESKASFIPSKWERLKVGKYLHAIKMGWIKPAPPKDDSLLSNNYDLWSDEPKTNLPRSHIPAPKLELPGHHESYNPSAEYLLDDAEVEALKNKMESDYDENERQTKTLFIPKKYASLRQVPAYNSFVYERFQRCLDLYLCPRQRRLKANITDLNELIPDKPKPQDLHPYPMIQSLIYEGHRNMIRCLTCHSSGQWLASGSDDCTVRLWEISTTRCMNVFTFDKPVVSLQWNPVLSLLAVATGSQIVMINPRLGRKCADLLTIVISSTLRAQIVMSTMKSYILVHA
jgi:ribosome biogenesis protein ERB1